MSEDTTVPVALEFEVEGNGAEHLKELAEFAEKLGEKMEHVNEVLTDLLGVAGLLGGAFSFEKMIEATNEHIDAVSRLTKQTHLAAEEADGLLEFFDSAGLSAEDVSSVLGRMSMSALRMQDAMNGMGGSIRRAQMMFRQMHVDLSRGLVPSLMQMSEQVVKGRINADRLVGTMHVAPELAYKLVSAMKRGPEAIRETMEEMKRSGLAATQADLESRARFKHALAEMKSAFERISFVIGREIVPVLTDVMEEVAEGVKGWIASAKKFGEVLGFGIREAVRYAKTLGEILLVNAALTKVGVTGGLIGGARTVYGAAAKFAATTVAPSLAASGSLVADGGNLLFRGLGLAKFGAELSGLALIIPIVVGGIEGLIENFNGVRDFVIEGFDDVMGAFAGLGDALGPLVPILSDVGGWLSEIFKEMLPLALNTILETIRLIVDLITTAVRFITDMKHGIMAAFIGPHGFDWTTAGRNLADTFKAVHEETNKRSAARKDEREAQNAARERAKNGRADNSQHFYNPRFDISQQFAEGYEPDRILTAFTHDLAALGERGMQSNSAPLGSVGIVGGG